MESWKDILRRLKGRWRWIILVFGVLFLSVFWILGFKTEIGIILRGYSDRTLKIYCVVMLLIMLLILGLGIFYIKKKQIRLEKMFLVCALTAGLGWMFLLPPLSAPDEIVHYSTAYGWSNRMLFINALDEDGMVRMRAEDAKAPFAVLNSQTKEDYRAFYDAFLKPCENSEIVSFSYEPMRTGPFPHLPQAIGITFGRLLHMGWADTMLLGRLGNFLFFILCMYQAIKRVPFGKMIFFVAAMLPMTQELASSMSYDVVPLSLAFLFTAVCFEDAFVKEKMGKREVAVLSVLLMALVPCKIVYALLAGLCLLIPKEKFGSRRFYFCSAATVIFLSVFSLAVNNMSTLSGYVGGGENYIEWADAPGYTLKMLLAKPVHFLYLLLNTIRTQTGFYWETMLGSKLGWLNVPLSSLYVVGFSALLFLAAFKEEEGKASLAAGNRVWCLVLCTGVSFLVLLSMLLGWTPVGQLYVRGVQGRYFLPILPLFLLTLRNRRLIINGSFVTEGILDQGIILSAVVLNVLALQRVTAAMLAGCH